MQTRSPIQVKQDFESNGQTVSSWAIQHGFEPQEVYKVLNGQAKCKRGKGHTIAVMLGMKKESNQISKV